jgi:hypothetical protein
MHIFFSTFEVFILELLLMMSAAEKCMSSLSIFIHQLDTCAFGYISLFIFIFLIFHKLKEINNKRYWVYLSILGELCSFKNLLFY